MSPVEHELQTHAAALRRLARDLVGSFDADDLVQETALRALRSPPHLPGGLGGFLATILRRLAGTHWREQRRRLRREQAAARPEPVQAPDQALERGETLQLLTAAVMALPQPYRDVVLQRYFEGLRPAAIARHLDLPVATVKTRLQRGLQKLREQLDANRERSAWRGALAGAFGLGRLAAGLTGVFVMGTGTKLAIGGAAALLAAVAWVARPGEPGTAMATGSIEASSAQPVVAAAGTGQGTPAAETPLLREEVQPAQASPGKHVTIRGRCVDAASKAPLPDCRVSVSAWSRGNSLPAPAAPIVTGLDGCLLFTFAPLAEGTVTVECRAEGRLRRNAYLRELSAEVIDLGDVEMARGARVHGRVIDRDGRPVADCRLGIAGLAIALRSTTSAELIRAGSKDDGTFAFDDPVPAGTWPLEDVGRAGWAHVGPRSITVLDGDATLEVVVACAPTPSICGSVVDAEGRPIAEARVQPFRESSGRYPSATSKADGSFELFALETDPDPERLEVSQATGFELPPRTEPIAWGTRGVRFVLQRGVGIDVEVVERASQRPVEEFAATAPKENGPFPSPEWPMARWEHGRIHLDGLERGRHIVAVLPKDPMLLPDQVMVDVQPGIAPVRIEIERMSPQSVIVRDAANQPIVGAVVEVRHVAKDPALEWRAFDFRRQWPSVNQLRLAEHPGAVLYWRAETDARGETTVGIPGNDDEIAVRATCHGRAPLIVRKPTIIPDQPLILTLHDAARLKGRVRVAGYPGRTFLLLFPDAVSEVMTRVDLAADGSFRVEDLEPGPRVLRWGLELSGSTWPLDPPLQEAVLRPGETASLDLDASRFDAGTIKGTIVVNGQRLDGGRVDVFVKLSRPGRSRADRFGPFVVDDKGVFTAVGVLPGKCSVRMRIEDHGHESWLAHEHEVVVSAGGTVEREFHFLRRRLKVRVLDSQGGPLAGRRIWAVPPTPPSRMAKTDAAGVAVFDWMPAGRITFRQKPGGLLEEAISATGQTVRPGEGKVVEIPVDQAETTVDVRWQ